MNTPKMQSGEWLRAVVAASYAVVGGAAILAAIYSIWFTAIHPELERFNSSDKLETATIKGTSFRRVYGNVIQEGGATLIAGFSGGRAIVTTQARFYAEDFPFIKFRLKGVTTFTNAMVFWRRSSNPQRLYTLPLGHTNGGTVQVGMFNGGQGYSGVIEEIGLIFSDGTAIGTNSNNSQLIRVEGAQLLPLTPYTIFRQVLSDLLNPPLWQAYSINVTRGAPAGALFLPNLGLNLLAGVSVVLLALTPLVFGKSFSRDTFMRSAFIAVLLCWFVGDLLRWQTRIDQLNDSYDRYAGRTYEEKIRQSAIRCGKHPNNCKADLLPYF